MKLKISVSMDESTINEVEEKIKTGIYGNKSHFIEVATKKQLREK